ncbi:MAG TPA: hypothetical protein VGJ74_11715 [Burkholderiales bacterium]
MDLCTVETGLLKKKPCGEQAVTKCGNCEQPLCKRHAVPQASAGQRKPGGFLCPECAKAWKAQEKAMGPIGESSGAASPAPAAKKPAEQTKAPAAAKAAPAEKKTEPPPIEHSGPLEFTPEPKKPDDKK